MGRGGLMVVFMVTMYVGGGLIPGYLNMKSFGLVNTRLIMIIDGALSVYNMIVARTFFANTIPGELADAARIDGCSDFGIFSRIVMPLSKAIVAVMGLYYGVGHWNSYMQPLLYLSDRTKYPLQLVLKNILISSQPDASLAGMNDRAEMYKQTEMLKYALVVVSSAPMIVLYPFVQKYFVQGVMVGSVKG